MRASFVAYVIAPALALSLPVSAEEAESHIGVFVDQFETSNFEPCDSDEHWWLRADGQVNPSFWNRVFELRAEHARLTGEELGGGSPPYYLEATGLVTDLGDYGHMGQYDREFRVSSFGVFRLATHEEMRRCITSGFLPFEESDERPTRQ